MYSYDNYLEHHGIKGQRWGVRRFQNEDGTRTSEGQKRYNQNTSSFGAKIKKAVNKTGEFAKTKIKQKIDERNGKSPASSFSDSELNERLARMRKEAEYTRLQREIKGGNQNQGGGKKGGGGKNKHPYLALAVLTPAAVGLGVATKAITKEKVTKFLEHRATIKMRTLQAAKNAGRSTDVLKRMYDDAMRAFKTAVDVKNSKS